jgi:hypothetical protein
LRNDSQWVIILTDGVIAECLKEKNCPINYEYFMNNFDSLLFRLNHAVKIQLFLTSLNTLIRCSGNFVIFNNDLRLDLQSLLKVSLLLIVAISLLTILSNIESILRKCLRYFYALTYCSLIIFTSKEIPM